MTAYVAAFLFLPRLPRWLLALAACVLVALAAGRVLTLIEEARRRFG